MFQPSFRIRRLVSLAVTLVALLLVALIAWIEEGRFGDASMLTGFTLLSTVLLLMLIGARRRLPVLRLGSMSTWTQCHLYLGLFSVGVFWMHVPTILGNGLFEGGLSLLFLLVSGSGVYGIYASLRTSQAADGRGGPASFRPGELASSPDRREGE